MSESVERPQVTVDRAWIHVTAAALVVVLVLLVVVLFQMSKLRTQVSYIDTTPGFSSDTGDQRTLVELCGAIGQIARAQKVSLAEVWSPGSVSDCEQAAAGK